MDLRTNSDYFSIQS